MTGKAFAAVLAVAVAFGGAFAVGGATVDTDSPADAAKLNVSSDSPEVPGLERAEPLPGLRNQPDSPARAGGTGSSQQPHPEALPTPSTSPAPSPAPSPDPAPAPSDGGGFGGGGGEG